MSDNKLVKAVTDAATQTGSIAKKVVKETFTADPSSNVMSYVKFTAVMAGSIALTQYLQDQKILPEPKQKNIHYTQNIYIYTFIYTHNGERCHYGRRGCAQRSLQIARALSEDDPNAALKEKVRHGKALEAFNKAIAKYQKDRTKLLDWIATNDRMKTQAKKISLILTTLKLYNQNHQNEQITMPKEPKFANFYQPSKQQKDGELMFIGAGTLTLGYATFRFL